MDELVALLALPPSAIVRALHPLQPWSLYPTYQITVTQIEQVQGA